MDISVDIEIIGKGEKRESVGEILRPTTLFCWILGVSVPRLLDHSKQTTGFMRLVHVAICSVIVAYGTIDFFTFRTIYKSDTFKIIYYSNKVAGSISSYYYVGHGFYNYTKWPALMARIASIDRKMTSFELNRGDRLLNIFQYSILLVIILLGPISMAIHGIYYYFIRPQDIFASDLLLYYTITQSLAAHFSFDLIVFAMYSRFKAINRVMRTIDDGATELIILQIRRVRELHHAVCKLVRFVNGIYGVQLLLGSVNSFTMVVATLFRIYMGVVEQKYEFMIINNVIWITYAAQLSLTCCVCTEACAESSKTGELVRDFVLSLVRRPRTFCDLYVIATARASQNSEISLRNEINDLSAQLHASDVAFTACNFFIMNNALLRSFISVTTTYLIILVQFYQPEVRNQDSPLSTSKPEAIRMSQAL